MHTQNCLNVVSGEHPRPVLERCSEQNSFKWHMDNFDVNKLAPELQIYSKKLSFKNKGIDF